MKKIIVTILLSAAILGTVFLTARYTVGKEMDGFLNKVAQVVGADFNRFTTPPTNTAIACGTTSTLAVATSSGRVYVALVNDSANTVYLGLGKPAVGSNGIRLNASGGSYEIDPQNLFTGAINCIASSTSVLTVISQ